MIVTLEPKDVKASSKDEDIFSLRLSDFAIFNEQLVRQADHIVFATGFFNDEGQELYIGLKDREHQTPFVFVY